MGYDDSISLEEASQLIGVHENSLRRTLRQDPSAGFKTLENGHWVWRVYTRWIERYTNMYRFGFDRPGPRPSLVRGRDSDDADW